MRFKDIYSENFLSLEEAIVKTVAYFDMFAFPLTGFEIWQNLEVKCELMEVLRALDEKIKAIESRNGFYFLAGRDRLVETRLVRFNSTDRKFKRALALIKIYKFIPWIKVIALGNLMGAHNLKEESDIDLFIITAAKRIWLTRFFCIVLAEIFGLRPKPGKSRDKVCLSFFVSEEQMNLSALMLGASHLEGERINFPRPPRFAGDAGAAYPSASASRRRDGSLLKGADTADIYFIYWLANLTPLYDSAGIYEKFIKANFWLKEYLPNWRSRVVFGRRQGGLAPANFYCDLADLFLGGLEPWFKALELELLPKNLRELKNLDTRVVMNDRILKLHANDRREEYRERYLKKINELL